MSENAQRQRSNYLDNIKGVLILLVVFGHFLLDYQDNDIIKGIVQLIYLFHMPAFVFKSGYLSKSTNSRGIVSLLKLFSAYYIFNGLFLVLNIIRDGEVSVTEPYLSYWYLIAMIAWRLSIDVISKIKYAQPLSVLLALFVGFCPEVGDVLAMSRIVAFYPFFLWGYRFSRESMQKYGEIKAAKKLCIGFALMAASAGAGVLAGQMLTLTDANLTMEPYTGWEELAVRVVMFVISTAAIFMLLTITTDRKLPLITMAGRNSLSVFLLHRIFPLVYIKLIAAVFGEAPSAVIILSTALVCTLGIMLVFGLDMVNRLVNRITSVGATVICPDAGQQSFGNSVIKAGYLVLTLVMLGLIIYKFI